MTTTQRTILLALIFALIAGSFMAVETEAKRKRGHRHDARPAEVGQDAPASLLAPADLDTRLPNIDLPGKSPEPDPCAEAEATLNGFLPKTVTLRKTDTYLAKLTVDKGASVLECDLASGDFEVKFSNARLRQYGKVPYVGGWNQISSNSCSLRVSFALGFAPPNTVILSDLKVLAVNCTNSPNWLDSSVVKDGLNAIFPETISFQV